MPKKDLEQTLVLIKPDAMKNSLTGYILSMLSEFHTGLRFAALKIVSVNRFLAEEHYAEHKGKAFFPSLLEYITGQIHYPDEHWKRRVIAIVYQGEGAIQRIRDIAGNTNPHVARDQKPGCIRALGTVVPIKDAAGNVISERMDNLIHASANKEDAEREIKLWFKPNDIPPMMQPYPVVVSSEHFYFKDGKLFQAYEQGSLCFIAPGDIVWKTDHEALVALSHGKAPKVSFESVVAKYLINKDVKNTGD
jgi:nucleoside-diphosphate kinase